MTESSRIICRKVAVVVLGYNSLNYLKKFLPSVLATNYGDFTTVFVDNASTDDSVEYVKRTFPDIKIFRIYENRGFTNGYEASLPFIDADYYVLINSDVRVDPNWLAPMMAEMETDPSVGACQPKIIHEPKPPLFDYAGASGGFIDRFGYPFCRGRLFHLVESDHGQYNDTREIFWATGACMLIRSKLYHDLGGLDNDFYAHMEEIDLCWRLKNAGHKILVVPEAVVYHVGGSVITYGSYTKIFHNYRNNLVMMFKNLSVLQLFTILPLRILLDQVAALRALISGSFTELRAILSADLHFLYSIRRWAKSRKKARKMVNHPNLTGWYNQSLILDVFLRKKKKFSELNSNKMT